MKKIVTWLFVLGFVCTMSACAGDDHKNTLIVGSEQFGGYFLPSEGFTNTKSDATIRTLLHGGETVTLDEAGELRMNDTNIANYTRSEETNGDVTYTITLADFTWSDGTSVVADDYLFAYLLAASPAYGAAGALDATGEGLVGYWDYYNGTTPNFKGIRKITDTCFSLTIDHEELPYFWELMYISVTPYPMHVLIQEGEGILSDETGITFDGDMEAAVDRFIHEYNKTLNPTCGAYTLASYESGQVRLKRNEAFIGDEHGKKPAIDEIIVKEVNMDTAMDALINGEINLLEPVMIKETIDKGAKAVEEKKLQRVDYSRNGYGVLSMKADKAPTNEVEVRRAIGYLVDREQLLNDILGSYGEVYDSDYVASQWMAQEHGDFTLPYAYHASIALANESLDASTYRYEADGITPFDATKASQEYLRYNEKQEPLTLRHLATNGNNVSDLIEAQLMEACTKVGISYVIERTDEAGLQDAYYFASEQGLSEPYQLFTLGIEFASIPDPYYASYACEYAGTSANPGNICDETLDEAMRTMRHTSNTDTEAFLSAWEAYVKRFNEVLPQLPLYTSTYAGFADIDLSGYHPDTYLNWADQVADLAWK